MFAVAFALVTKLVVLVESAQNSRFASQRATPGPPPNSGKTTFYTVPIGESLKEEHYWGLASNISKNITIDQAHKEAISIAQKVCRKKTQN